MPKPVTKLARVPSLSSTRPRRSMRRAWRSRCKPNMISSSGRRFSISIGAHLCSSEAVISDDGSRCPMRAVEQPHTSVHITRCDRSHVPFSTLDLMTAALIFSVRFHPLPIVFQNRAGVLKKHCPSVENPLPVVFQFVGQRISVRRATNFRSFGNRIRRMWGC